MIYIYLKDGTEIADDTPEWERLREEEVLELAKRCYGEDVVEVRY